MRSVRMLKNKEIFVSESSRVASVTSSWTLRVSHSQCPEGGSLMPSLTSSTLRPLLFVLYSLRPLRVTIRGAIALPNLPPSLYQHNK